jgi:hypothetical protein
VAIIACLSVEAQAQQAQQYIKADRSKTNDLEAAAQSWRMPPQALQGPISLPIGRRAMMKE